MCSLSSVRSLGINRIGDEGASALGEAVKVNSSLKSLDLQRNGIGDEGATAIGDALRVNASLTRLILDFNDDINDEAAAALREVVKGRRGFYLSVRSWGRG